MSKVTHLVESFIDGLVVVGLYRAKVRLDELEVAIASEEGHTTGVIKTGSEHNEQIVDEQGLVVQVELESFVVELYVSHLDQLKL